jgi:hypothetical protein
MCQKVVIDLGEKELQTVKEFKDYFKVELPIPENAEDVIVDDACLCQIDIESELKKLNIPFAYDYCDYYVGEGIEQINQSS